MTSPNHTNRNMSARPALGASGMVGSAHPLATQAGLDILQAGGNAFDAAVATAATLNVVEPMMSGIGGYGTIMLYDAEAGKAWFLNSSGRIPLALDSDAFRPPTPGYLENRRGAKAVSTPGNLNAWAAIGTPGGHTIGQTVPQMLPNLLYFRMDIQQAIAAPRISFVEPDVIAVEDDIPEPVRQELAKMGHTIRVENGLGNAHGLTIEYDSEGKPCRFTGGADPRGEGAAMGY